MYMIVKNNNVMYVTERESKYKDITIIWIVVVYL